VFTDYIEKRNNRINSLDRIPKILIFPNLILFTSLNSKTIEEFDSMLVIHRNIFCLNRCFFWENCTFVSIKHRTQQRATNLHCNLWFFRDYGIWVTLKKSSICKGKQCVF